MIPSWEDFLEEVFLDPKFNEIGYMTLKVRLRSISHEVMGPDAMILVFRMLSFKPTISLSSFTFIIETTRI